MRKTTQLIKRSPQLIALLAALLVLVSASMTSPFFYLNWGLGAVLILWFAVCIFTDKTLDKRILLAAVISCLWLIVPIFNQLFGQLRDSQAQLKKLMVFIFDVAFSSAVVYFLHKIEHRKGHRLLQVIAILWAAVSLLSLALFYAFKPAYVRLFSSRDFAGILENRNTYAMLTTLLLAFLTHFRSYWKHKVSMLIACIALFVFILLTRSTKGLIGLLFFLFFEGVCILRKRAYSGKTSRKKSRLQIMALVLVICALLGALTITENPVSKNLNRVVILLTNPEELRAGESIAKRAFFITESIKVIGEHPFTGIGFWNSAYFLIPPTMKAKGMVTGAYSHINYLEMLLGGGIFTFLLFYIPLLAALVLVFKNRKQSDWYIFVLFAGLYLLLMSFAAVTFDIQYFVFIQSLVVYTGVKSLGDKRYRASNTDAVDNGEKAYE